MYELIVERKRAQGWRVQRVGNEFKLNGRYRSGVWPISGGKSVVPSGNPHAYPKRGQSVYFQRLQRRRQLEHNCAGVDETAAVVHDKDVLPGNAVPRLPTKLQIQ